MKIILVKDVQKLGKKLDLKRVKPGYARNFLIPQKLAILASRKNLKWWEKQKEIEKTKDKEKTKNLKELLEKIKKTPLKISVKAGLKGELFEKINEAKIAKILKEKDYDIKKENIILKNAISKVGEYEAIIKLGEGIEAKVKVKIIKGKQNQKEKKPKTKISISKKETKKKNK